MKTVTALILVALTGPGPGQDKLNLVGTWVVDEASASAVPMSSDFKVTFRKDGTASLTAFGTKGTGTYRIIGNKVDIRLTKTEGSRLEHSALGVVAEGGKALLFDTGAVKGPRQVKVRLIREPHRSKGHL